ncbi:hypothetical protein [Bradyrhizobium sp. LeoA1S1]
MVDAGPILATATGNLAPPTLFIDRADDQFTPEHPTPRLVEVETLLMAAPAASDVVAASAPSAWPVAFPATKPGDDGPGWTWLGVLLMALGLVSVLSSSRPVVHGALLHQPK